MLATADQSCIDYIHNIQYERTGARQPTPGGGAAGEGAGGHLPLGAGNWRGEEGARAPGTCYRGQGGGGYVP